MLILNYQIFEFDFSIKILFYCSIELKIYTYDCNVN